MHACMLQPSAPSAVSTVSLLLATVVGLYWTARGTQIYREREVYRRKSRERTRDKPGTCLEAAARWWEVNSVRACMFAIDQQAVDARRAPTHATHWLTGQLDAPTAALISTMCAYDHIQDMSVVKYPLYDINICLSHWLHPRAKKLTNICYWLCCCHLANSRWI